MKRAVLPLILLMALSMMVVGRGFAQEDTCEEIIAAAMQSTTTECSAVDDNQACYGHVLVQAFPQTEASTLNFSAPGDLADLVALQTLRVSALDTDNGFWGIVLMQLLAQVSNDNPVGVSMLVFGSVELENSVTTPAQVDVQNQGTVTVTVRERPFRSAQPIDIAEPGQFLIANGRLDDTSWLRVEVPDTGRLGWVFAELVVSDEDLSTLPVVSGEAPHFGSLQAFQLETGIEAGSECDNAPPDGILVQTPEGIAEVTFLVNEVNIQLRATAFVQAESGREMVIAVLDGNAQVEAMGVTQNVPAGMMVRIPMDDNLFPAGPPGTPEPYRGVVLAVKQLAWMFGGGGPTIRSAEELEEQLQFAEITQPSTGAQPPPSSDSPPPPDSNQSNQGGGSSDGGSSGGGGDSGGGGAPGGGGGGAPGGGGGAPGG